jgi:biotin carboxylase
VRALVVLGAADGAITTLRTAHRIGLRTICVDQRADAPALRYADEHLHVSTRDGETLTGLLAGRTDLAGVASPASDVNLPSQHLLARRLGLPSGLSGAAVRASVDKGFFRALCDRLGQPGPRYLQGPPERVVSLAATRLAFPMIVKPSDSSGGRGISLCRLPAELADAVVTAVASSATRLVIAEEYLPGTHYTAEAVVRDGEIALLGLGRRVLTPLPHFVTVEHTMPAGPAGLAGRVCQMLAEVCRELGYRWGSLNADVLVTPEPATGHDRVVLVELGTRLGGNGSAELLGLVNGIDVTEAYVRMAVGEHPPLVPRRQAYAAFRVLRTELPGRLVAIHGTAAVRGLSEVVDLVISASPGDPVEPYHRAGAKAGYVLVASPDPDQVRATLDQIEALLQIEVAPAEPVPVPLTPSGEPG